MPTALKLKIETNEFEIFRNCLGLFEHCPDLLVVAVENNVDLSGLLHLLQDLLVVVVVLEVELLHDNPRVVLVS